LKQRLTETTMQILTSEAPGKRFAKSGVSYAEVDDAVGQSPKLVQSFGVSTFRWRIQK